MSQQRNGRRGSVFPVRLTDEQRAELERLQQQGKGPRALGPWLVWRALHPRAGAGITAAPSHSSARSAGNTRAQVLPGRRGNTSTARKPIILDLCAGSGSWSAPYARSGLYQVIRVTLPKHDVRTFVPPRGVHGVLAAPPCDQFSLARNGIKSSPRDLVRGMETVNACMRIIAQCAPAWWALENPVGLLSKYLGTPRDSFEPCDFGDPWTKRTALWGNFTLPTRGPFVKPLGGGPLCTKCDIAKRRTGWCSKPEHRAITPSGFARAFFRANP